MKCNVVRVVEDTQKKINPHFDLSVGEVQEIMKNWTDRVDLIYSVFFVWLRARAKGGTRQKKEEMKTPLPHPGKGAPTLEPGGQMFRNVKVRKVSPLRANAQIGVVLPVEVTTNSRDRRTDAKGSSPPWKYWIDRRIC